MSDLSSTSARRAFLFGASKAVAVVSVATLAPVVTAAAVVATNYPPERMIPVTPADPLLPEQLNQLVRAVNRLNGFAEEVEERR